MKAHQNNRVQILLICPVSNPTAMRRKQNYDTSDWDNQLIRENSQTIRQSQKKFDKSWQENKLLPKYLEMPICMSIYRQQVLV